MGDHGVVIGVDRGRYSWTSLEWIIGKIDRARVSGTDRRQRHNLVFFLLANPPYRSRE